jgi:outer membrane receptor protein involved in Fe transport
MISLSACPGLLSLRQVSRLMGTIGAILAHGAAGAATNADLADLPLEQLLTLEVVSASKFVQKVSEAPSAVSVVTAADIKAFGWRSLADVLRSMRGVVVTGDRNYSYMGVRGFQRPGDYNTRILLLVDGYRTNDAVFDQASLDREFMLDVDLIERVEFVPGPGSSIYGANAFFGVVNVMTRHARDLPGAQVSAEAGSYGTGKGRVSYGWRGENGAELLLSASRYSSRGQDLYYREFDQPENNNGIARNLDFDRGSKLFVKASAGPFRLTVVHSEQAKGIPTASYSQVFNDPRSRTVNAQDFVDAAYLTALSGETDLSSRIYWGRNDYLGSYIYDRPPVLVNRDGSHARWWGGEAKLVTTLLARQKLVAGIEYQRDYRRDQFNYDINNTQQTGPALPANAVSIDLDDRRSGNRAGIYLQDEITLRNDLLFNAGLRYDHNDATGGIFNPRLALVYRVAAPTTLKLLYGMAYRAPNAYESFYQLLGPGGQKANPDLKPERIRSQELILEHYLSPDMRLTATLFRNTVSDLITQTFDESDGLLVFRNLEQATARGLGMELERVWAGGTRLRTSFNLMATRDATTGEELVNSPRRLAKLNVSNPVFGDAWRAGAEVQYVGRRASLQGEVGAYWLANFTLSSIRLAKNLEVSASVYNLFDRRYADPGSGEHVQDAIQQDGRNFRLKVGYTF